MSDFDHLFVYLVDCDTTQPLQDFDTAKTIPKNSNRQRRVAVEAKADQHFAIDIYVGEGFDWADSNGLELRIGFDVGEEVNSRSVYLLRDDKRLRGINLPCLTKKGCFYHHRLDHILLQDPNGDVGDALRWQFYFRKLRDDALANSHKGLPRTLDSQGKIRIEIARAVISPREYDKGIETDVTPAFRRHTTKTLLRRGITLEVLLGTDPATNRTKYQGNFRSDRPKRQNHQVNFDFVYRETGHHDSYVAAGDVIEVGRDLGTSSTVEAIESVKANNALNSLALAKNQSTALVSPSPNFDAVPARRTEGTASNASTNIRSSMLNHTADTPLLPSTLPVLTAGNSQNETTIDYITSDESIAGASTSRSLSRSQSETGVSACTDITALTNMTGTFNNRVKSDEMSDIMKAVIERQTADANELRTLESRVTDIKQQQRLNEERSRTLRAELDKVNAESYALDETRRELEEQQHQIVVTGDKLTREVQQAWEKCHDAMKEILEHSIELANTRKRKRSEEV